jgi:serine/threonine protein kinase
MSLRIGETFAGYRVLRLLGAGGMGEVYLVQHPRLPRHEALKVLRPDVSSDTSFRERFNREADLAAGLRHPHIVGIHDRGEHDGQLWIAMDYIDGSDAAQLVQQRYPAGMTAEQTIPIIAAVASALDYAHKKSLLHRDVKPANIIVADLDTDERRVFLADFGIARPLDDTSGITTTNMTVGTVAYAAPEQLMGEQMDGRADQYALAATTYQLLTGLQLFTHSNPAVVISRHLNTMPPALGDLRPDLAGFDDALRVALAKDPDDRYPSCTAFAHALTNASAPATSLRTTASAPVAGKRPASGATELRPMPSATKKLSANLPPKPIAVHEQRPRWPVIVSTLAIVILLAAVAVVFVVRPWEHDRASNGTTTAPTAPSSSITFDGMRDFVTGYYRDLPAHPMDAWAKLDAYCQEQTGLNEFVDFWATVRSVELISVNPRDATSVVARLRYVRHDGQTDTEDRWLRWLW